MTIRILLFSYLRQALGESVTVELPLPATAGDVLEAFLRAHPQYRLAAPSLSLAVNRQYARLKDPVPPGAEVAIIPPVSGGR